jgi:aminopeptidase N
MRSSLIALSVASVLLAGCPNDKTATDAGTAPATPADSAAVKPDAATAEKVVDEHSYAQPEKVQTQDVALDLAVNFDKKILTGTATLGLQWLDKSATELTLDTRDLDIQKVEAEGANGAWEPLKFKLDAADKILGSKLTIETPNRPAKVRITYATSPNASGLQWLEPSMTEGKKTPFMFSQSQQIHARSWVPLQDTPMIRFTYTAHITSPKDTMVLMSADNDP